MDEKTLHQYVKKNETKKTLLKKVGILAIFAVALICALNYEPFYEQRLIIAIGAILIFSALIRNLSVEYEYTLSDGIFSVDAVYGVSKRKNELTIPVTAITSYAVHGDDDFDSLVSSTSQCLELTSSDTSPDRICFFSESECVAFVIEPNTELLKALCGGICNDN